MLKKSAKVFSIMTDISFLKNYDKMRIVDLFEVD